MRKNVIAAKKYSQFSFETCNLLDFQQMNVGDIVYGKIQSLQTGGHLLRLLCTQPPNFHIFSDVKARVTFITIFHRS